MQLLLPVVDQRGGADNQAYTCLLRLQLLRFRRTPLFLLRFQFRRQKRGDHLKRFSESHLIGEDASEAIAVKNAKPAIPLLLIFPQRLRQRIRNLEIGILHRFEFLDQLLKFFIANRIQILRLLQHLVEIQGTVSGKLHLALHEFLQGNLKCLEHLTQFFDRIVLIQFEKTAVFEPDIFFLAAVHVKNLINLVLRQILCRNRKIQQIAFHIDADLHRKPAADSQIPELCRHAHLSIVQELIDPVIQKPKQPVIVFLRIHQMKHRIVQIKILMQRIAVSPLRF